MGEPNGVTNAKPQNPNLILTTGPAPPDPDKDADSAPPSDGPAKTKPPKAPVTPSLPWTDKPAPPDQENEACAKDDKAGAEPIPELPWDKRPKPGELHSRPLLPWLRWGVAGLFKEIISVDQLTDEDSYTFTGGGRFDVYLAEPNLRVFPKIGIYIPIFFLPVIESTLTSEDVSVGGGLLTYIGMPDVAAIYLGVTGGAAYLFDTGNNLEHEQDQVYPYVNMIPFGFQTRLYDDNPLFLGFVEYNHGFLPSPSNGLTAGMRLKL